MSFTVHRIEFMPKNHYHCNVNNVFKFNYRALQHGTKIRVAYFSGNTFFPVRMFRHNFFFKSRKPREPRPDQRKASGSIVFLWKNKLH